MVFKKLVKPRVRFHEEANINKNVMYTSQGKVDQIRCIVEGYPRPVVSLTRNGSPISEQAYTYEKTQDAKDQVSLRDDKKRNLFYHMNRIKYNKNNKLVLFFHRSQLKYILSTIFLQTRQYHNYY